MLVYMNDIFLCKQINFVITNMTTLLYMRFANCTYVLLRFFILNIQLLREMQY